MITHVGIYVGNNQMYHAGNPIGYTDLTSAYWHQHIICAGRIKQLKGLEICLRRKNKQRKHLRIRKCVP